MNDNEVGAMRNLLGALAGLLLLGGGAAAAPQSVTVENKSTPTLCAEEDNVHLDIAGPKVRRFRVEAVHPAYIGTIVVDNFKEDLRNCVMPSGPAYSAPPERLTLHETVEWQLIGYRFAKFWRDSAVTVRVGDRVEKDIHLLQVWTRFQERAEEVLVLYPADGYWRARPLPPANLRWSAYGTSFLIGPVEQQGRPIVDLKTIAYDPEKRSFRLEFARGGDATLTLMKLDQTRIVLDVALGEGLPATLPFAALRSMFVTNINADAAEVKWRRPGETRWRDQGVMEFKKDETQELWLGRTVPSQHNTSAPDTIVGPFDDAPGAVFK